MNDLQFKAVRTKTLTFGEGELEVTVRVGNELTDYVAACGDVTDILYNVEDLAAFTRRHPTNSKPSEVKITARDVADQLERSIKLPSINLIAVDLETGNSVINFCIRSTASVTTNSACAKDRLVTAITGKRATHTLRYTGYKIIPGTELDDFADNTVLFEDSEAFTAEFEFMNTYNINGLKLKEFIEAYL